MKCDVKIMAVKPRRKMVLAMCDKLGLSEDECVIYDDRPNGGGTYYTCRKAWSAPMPDDVTHRIVLQDDLALCNDFMQIADRMVTAHPDVFFTLFCPRVHFEDRLPESPYLIVKGYNTWGQGIILPREYIKKVMRFSDEELGTDFQWDDGQYAWYAKENSIPIMTTVPSLLQHLCPTESTLGYNNKNKVSKVWNGEDISGENWEAKSFTFTKSMPITVSLEKQKKLIAEKGNNTNPYTIFRDNGGNKFEDSESDS